MEPGDKSRKKVFFYETIAERLDELMNPYDLRRRLDIVFEELLPRHLAGLLILDVGCGTGWFSKWAIKRNARVVSVDLGASLLRATRRKTASLLCVADSLRLPFPDETFDAVISSEMVEHSVDPGVALVEMGRVLNPTGTLALTCPNKLWQWLVVLATRMGVRPFQGFENFPSFPALENLAERAGLRVVQHIGFHPWPFQLRFRFMINQAIRAQKKSAS